MELVCPRDHPNAPPLVLDGPGEGRCIICGTRLYEVEGRHRLEQHIEAKTEDTQ